MENKSPAELVRTAFEMARRSGKADWTRMTLPVLKNRLLTLTRGGFREADYGAKTIREFADQAASVARVNDSIRPAEIEWLSESDEAPEPAKEDRNLGMARVRPDLWRAVLDYSSGRQYMWDQTLGKARERRVEDTDPLLLPTTTLKAVAEWRQQFAGRMQASLPEAGQALLKAWADHSLPSAALPGQLRGEWNGELKRRVEGTIREWFDKQNLKTPDDAFTQSASSALPKDDEAHIQALRALVLECVNAMTEAELREIRLPAAAILRTRRTRVR